MLEGLPYDFWNPYLNQALSQLEDEALHPALTTRGPLSAGVPKKKSNTVLLATHSFCHRPCPAHLPQSFTVSVDQVCGCSWVWCLGLQTGEVFSEQRKTSWHKEQSVSPPCQSPAFTHSANWPHHQNTKNPVVKTPKTEGLLPRSQKTQVPAQAPSRCHFSFLQDLQPPEDWAWGSNYSAATQGTPLPRNRDFPFAVVPPCQFFKKEHSIPSLYPWNTHSLLKNLLI